MTKRKNPLLHGFTLIELLVVIAIIGLLTTIVIVGLGYFKARGRDTKRVADISEIRKALAMYSSEKGMGFPIDNDGVCLKNDDAVSNELKAAETIKQVPTDPLWPDILPGGEGHCYHYVSDGTTFNLSYYLELTSSAGAKGVHSVGP